MAYIRQKQGKGIRQGKELQGENSRSDDGVFQGKVHKGILVQVQAQRLPKRRMGSHFLHGLCARPDDSHNQQATKQEGGHYPGRL